MNAKQSNLLTLVAIAIIFVAPIATSYYLNAIGWQSDKTRNRGHLLPSPVPMADKAFTLADNSILSLKTLKHTWALLYVGGQSCDQQCLKRIDELKRVHIALGKNQKRVQLLYLDSSASAAMAGRLKENNPGFKVLNNPKASVLSWKTQLDGVTTGMSATGMIFIIDPLGNIIMYYLPDEDAIGIRKDMGRLLHVSRVG